MQHSLTACRVILAVLVLFAGMTHSGAADDRSSGSSPVTRHLFQPGAAFEELWYEGEFTEGVAAAADGTIYFSDIPRGDDAGRVLKFDPATGNTTVHCSDSGKSNGLMFDASGRLIACCGSNGGNQALCEINRRTAR